MSAETSLRRGRCSAVTLLRLAGENRRAGDPSSTPSSFPMLDGAGNSVQRSRRCPLIRLKSRHSALVLSGPDLVLTRPLVAYLSAQTARTSRRRSRR